MSGPRYAGRAPELLLDLVEKTTWILVSKGCLTEAKAKDLGILLAEELARSWGGSFVYFPKGNWNGHAMSCFQLTDRDWNIYREYNGTNRREVCDKYKVSERRLYQIISAIRDQHQNHR